MLTIIALVILFFLIRILIKMDYKITQKEVKIQQYMQLYELMLRWYKNEEKGLRIENYFKSEGVEQIAIYGKGEIGELFYQEIKNSEQIKSLCWIDKFLETNTNTKISVFNISDVEKYKGVDMIVVTPVHLYDEIELELHKYGVVAEIISLEDIIYSI